MTKKIFVKIKSAFSALVFILAIGVLLLAVFARVSDKIPSIFGYSFHIVVTDSMTPKIKPGDLVIIRAADISEVEIGDDVVFVSPDPALANMRILHRVYDKTAEGYLLTSGIKEGAAMDGYAVERIVGVYVTKSSFFGAIFLFLLRPENVIFLTITITLLMATYRLAKKTIKLIKSPPPPP